MEVVQGRKTRLLPNWQQFWKLAFILDLLILAVGVAFNVAQSFLVHGQSADIYQSPRDIIETSFLFFLLAAIVPIMWVFSREKTKTATAEYLGLVRAHPNVWKGLALGACLFLLLIPLQVVLEHFAPLKTTSETQNLLATITFPAILLYSAMTAFSEEVLFRGILQKRVGLHPQAFLFALVHFQYDAPMQVFMQVAIPLGVGYLFGYLMKSRGTLWLPIAAHFAFNFTQLAAGRLSA